MSVPPAVAAKALFQSDHTCCVCRKRGKRVEAHPIITAAKETAQPLPIAVLCSGCRGSDIDPATVQARHEEWVSMVACAQLRTLHLRSQEKPPSLEAVATLAESLRENEQFELLALLYHECGIAELRDKYIEKALAQQNSVRAALSLRALQGRMDQVDTALIDQQLEQHQRNEDWVQLARLQAALKRWPEAVQSYCRGLVKAIECGDSFSTGSILQEISQQQLHKALFELALRQAADENDFWWEVRALEAMGWKDELRDYITNKQAAVEQSDDMFLQLILFHELGDAEKALQIQKRILAEARTY